MFFVFGTPFHAGWLTGGDLVKTFLKIWIKLSKDAMPKIVFNEADVGIEREGLEVFEQESYGHSL